MPKAGRSSGGAGGVVGRYNAAVALAEESSQDFSVKVRSASSLELNEMWREYNTAVGDLGTGLIRDLQARNLRGSAADRFIETTHRPRHETLIRRRGLIDDELQLRRDSALRGIEAPTLR